MSTFFDCHAAYSKESVVKLRVVFMKVIMPNVVMVSVRLTNNILKMYKQAYGLLL